jgi:hypothetical protein
MAIESRGDPFVSVLGFFTSGVLRAPGPPGIDPGLMMIGSKLDLDARRLGFDADLETWVRGGPQNFDSRRRE